MKYDLKLKIDFDMNEHDEIIRPKSRANYNRLIILLEKTATDSSYLSKEKFREFVRDFRVLFNRAFDTKYTVGQLIDSPVREINKILALHSIPYHVFSIEYGTGINETEYCIKSYQYDLYVDYLDKLVKLFEFIDKFYDDQRMTIAKAFNYHTLENFIDDVKSNWAWVGSEDFKFDSYGEDSIDEINKAFIKVGIPYEITIWNYSNEFMKKYFSINKTNGAG